MDKTTAAAAIALAIVAVLAVYFLILYRPPAPEFHEHADFALFIDGSQFNFSLDKYMEKQTCGKPGSMTPESPIHLHNGMGGLVHVHAANMTWESLFSRLNMTLNATCFVDDARNSYCSDSSNALRMLVNGVQEPAGTDLGAVAIHDLDRVLITYGPVGQDTTAQMAAVTNMSCVFSGKCPQRAGEIANLPPEDNCAG